MSNEEAAASLKGAVPLLDEPLAEDLMTELNSIPPSLLSSPAFTSFPTSYLDRNRSRVDIYGAVESHTEEYQIGWRYFDHQSRYVRSDGAREEGQTSGRDIVALLDGENNRHYEQVKPTSIWVHPKHWQLSSFFRKFDGKNDTVKIGCHYLNRMGFLVSICDSFESKNLPQSFVDGKGLHYTPKGTRSASSSMTDILHVINNSDTFFQADWSGGELIGEQEEDLHPELFDPTRDSRKDLMQEFFQAVLTATNLSKKLGIEYTFFMGNTGTK